MQELRCAVMANGLVRADTLPLVFRALGAESLPRGTHVLAKVTGIDLLTLDVHASVVARLDEPPPPADEPVEADEAEERAGPLTLAIDVAEDGDGASLAADANGAAA